MSFTTKYLCIGLTGSIGSGKTTTGELFAKLGANTINADKIAHDLLEPKSEHWHKIIDKFSQAVLNKDLSINRDLLRQKCLNSSQDKLWLEQILHPNIIKTIKRKMDQQTNYYHIIEIPLLFETKLNIPLHRSIAIDLNYKVQLNRIMARNQWSQAEASAMIKLQLGTISKAYLADDIIDNNGNLHNLSQQVTNLHVFYKTLCPSKEPLLY